MDFASQRSCHVSNLPGREFLPSWGPSLQGSELRWGTTSRFSTFAQSSKNASHLYAIHELVERRPLSAAYLFYLVHFLIGPPANLRVFVQLQNLHHCTQFDLQIAYYISAAHNTVASWWA